MEERLQKLLSRWGVASRRQAEAMIVQRRVRVNGNTAQLGDSADPACDVIELDGVRLRRPPELRYLLLYKPRGYVTTLHDEKERKNVSQLLPPELGRLYPVGRLDLNSEGLLLMTNDGALANRLMHPKHQIEKVYLLWVSQYAPGREQTLTQPIEIDGQLTQPAGVALVHAENGVALLRVTLHEGRNRQIRRLCERAGLRVTRLKRIQEGPLCLGELAPGAYRPLLAQELDALMQL